MWGKNTMGIRSSFIREKRTSIGKYAEVAIYPRTAEAEMAVKKTRKRKQKVSRPVQQKLNDKNSRRYLRLKIQGCFGDGDLYGTLTYNKAHMPKTVEAAIKEMKKYTERLRYKTDKKGIALKYLYVTEFTTDEETGKITNIHHHILVGKGLSIDEVMESWASGRGKNKKRMGRMKWDYVQTDSDGLIGIATYFSKQERWKKSHKRWSCSQNLENPYETKNDHKYTRRKLEAYAYSNDQGIEQFEKLYPDYHITSVESVYYEETGWHFYLRMWRKKGPGGKQ